MSKPYPSSSSHTVDGAASGLYPTLAGSRLVKLKSSASCSEARATIRGEGGSANAQLGFVAFTHVDCSLFAQQES